MEDIIRFFKSSSSESYSKFDELCKDGLVKRGLLLQPNLLDHWINLLKSNSKKRRHIIYKCIHQLLNTDDHVEYAIRNGLIILMNSQNLVLYLLERLDNFVFAYDDEILEEIEEILLILDDFLRLSDLRIRKWIQQYVTISHHRFNINKLVIRILRNAIHRKISTSIIVKLLCLPVEDSKFLLCDYVDLFLTKSDILQSLSQLESIISWIDCNRDKFLASDKLHLKLLEIYIRLKSDYMKIDLTHKIFYYSLPEDIKKCCSILERLLFNYFLSEKMIDIVRYLAFQRLKILHNEQYGDLYNSCPTHFHFNAGKDVDVLVKRFWTENENFCFIFFAITILDNFSMITNASLSLEIKNDIFILIGLLHVAPSSFSLLGKYFSSKLQKKYKDEIGFGRGLVYVLQLHNIVNEKIKTINTVSEFCCDWIDTCSDALTSLLEVEQISRSQSVFSTRKSMSSLKYDSRTQDCISRTSVENQISVNDMCSHLTSFQTFLSRINHDEIKKKLKKLIQVIVSISIAQHRQPIETEKINLIPTPPSKRLEPITSKHLTSLKASYRHIKTLTDDMDSNLLQYKSSVVLPSL